MANNKQKDNIDDEFIFTQKISSTGTSIIIIIPSQIKEFQNLKKGDWLQVTARKIKENGDNGD